MTIKSPSRKLGVASGGVNENTITDQDDFEDSSKAIRERWPEAMILVSAANPVSERTGY
jgi:hypothetical protein